MLGKCERDSFSFSIARLHNTPREVCFSTKIDALKRSNGNFDTVCTISEICRSDLTWWCKNIMSAEKKILPANPDVTVRSDASV